MERERLVIRLTEVTRWKRVLRLPVYLCRHYRHFRTHGVTRRESFVTSFWLAMALLRSLN